MGANQATYAKPGAVPTDSGNYFVIVTNCTSGGASAATSMVSRVTVVPDVISPTLTRAVPSADLVTITLSFSEPISTASGESTGNYQLTPSGGGAALAISSAVLSSPSNVVLTTAARTFAQNYNLRISDLRDRAVASNPINPNPTTVLIRSDEMRLTMWADEWKYMTNVNLDDTGWQTVAFDDSTWPSGPGLLGTEAAAVVAGSGISDPTIRTPITPPNAGGSNTWYLRRTLMVPAIPATARYVLCHDTDDGAVFYVNGTEAGRYNITNAGPIAFDTPAINAIEVNATGLQSLALPLSAGANLIAVEVHNGGTASSDTLFGGELVAVNGTAELAISYDIASNTVTLAWDESPGWVLLQAAVVTGPYTPTPGNPTSPHVVTNPAGNVFFQLGYRGCP
jgi:hypothetical protein